MQSEKPAPKSRWYVRLRWGLSPLVIGVLLLCFVIFTGEAYAWTLWIAVPFIMIGLGYIFVVSAVESIWSIERHIQEIKEEEEKPDSLEHRPEE